MRQAYTPMQVRVGSWLGGPIAAVFFLRENFRVLDRSAQAKATLLWGAAFCVASFSLLPFLPDRFPDYLVPLAYSYAAGAIAAKWQLPKQAIVNSTAYQLQSNWRLCGISLLLAAAYLGIAFVELFSLDALGLVPL
ncbi:MAG TPA: hypothetical protein VGI93_19305 [Steroidobacteraceae bacterium]